MGNFIFNQVSNQVFRTHLTHSTCSACCERTPSTLHELPSAAHGLGIDIHSIPVGFNAKSTQREWLLHLGVVSRIDNRIQQRWHALKGPNYAIPPLAFN